MAWTLGRAAHAAFASQARSQASKRGPLAGGRLSERAAAGTTPSLT